jgi:hypothetical protein
VVSGTETVSVPEMSNLRGPAMNPDQNSEIKFLGKVFKKNLLNWAKRNVLACEQIVFTLNRT